MTMAVSGAGPSDPAARGRGLGPAGLMAAGLGWIGGTYAWPGPGWVGQAAITLLHGVPIAVVVVAICAIASDTRARAGRMVLTGTACLIKVTTVVALVWAARSPDGFGPHGLLDWVPVGMANAGGGLWIKTVIRSHVRARRAPVDGSRA